MQGEIIIQSDLILDQTKKTGYGFIPNGIDIPFINGKEIVITDSDGKQHRVTVNVTMNPATKEPAEVTIQEAGKALYKVTKDSRGISYGSDSGVKGVAVAIVPSKPISIQLKPEQKEDGDIVVTSEDGKVSCNCEPVIEDMVVLEDDEALEVDSNHVGETSETTSRGVKRASDLVGIQKEYSGIMIAVGNQRLNNFKDALDVENAYGVDDGKIYYDVAIWQNAVNKTLLDDELRQTIAKAFNIANARILPEKKNKAYDFINSFFKEPVLEHNTNYSPEQLKKIMEDNVAGDLATYGLQAASDQDDLTTGATLLAGHLAYVATHGAMESIAEREGVSIEDFMPRYEAVTKKVNPPTLA